MTIRTLARLVALCVAASLVVLASSASAEAAKPITGKLSKRGYTVIALGSNGKTDAVRSARGSFRVRPPGKGVSVVTLQLRAPNGVYAGPIVLGEEQHGRRAILGVNPGTKLGKIKVNVAKGYAKVKGRQPKGAIVAEPFARAKKGAPIGTGRNVGRVRSGGGSQPGDLDADGVPDVIDIDDDGDLILDNFDLSKKTQKNKKKARSAGFHPSGDFNVFSDLTVALFQAANAHAPGLDASQINSALQSYGELKMEVLPPFNGELDCAQPQSRTDPTLGGLVYCTKGGVGRIASGRFPDDFDPNGNGFGTMVDQQPLPGAHAMFLRHGADSSQIGTGDLLIQRLGGPAEDDPIATLQYVFATTPAPVSYDDGQGNSAVVSYPVPVNGPGNNGNGFPVAAGGDGHARVTLTFWRPQRRPISPETGDWIDIRGLKYGASAAGLDPGSFTCEQVDYSSSDPNLVPDDPTPQPGGGGFRDQDPPVVPSDTMTFTLDLTQCLTSKGLTFNPGEERGINLRAVTPQPNSDDQTAVTIVFKRL